MSRFYRIRKNGSIEIVITLVCLNLIFLTALFIQYYLQNYQNISVGTDDILIHLNGASKDVFDEFSFLNLEMLKRRRRMEHACSKFRKELLHQYSLYFNTALDWIEVNHSIANQMVDCKVESYLEIKWCEDFNLNFGFKNILDPLFNLSSSSPMEEIKRKQLLFINVFHPFQRILSAYRKVFLNQKSQEALKIKHKYSIMIIKEFRQNRINSGQFKNIPTFIEFVKYLIATPPHLYADYWKPLYLLCFSCHRQEFDAIVRWEAKKRDFLFLIHAHRKKRLKIIQSFINNANMQTSQKKMYPKLNGQVKLFEKALTSEPDERLSDGLEKIYYHLIPNDQKDKLYSKYIIDFEMFGYNRS